jgi:tight adherence protein C
MNVDLWLLTSFFAVIMSSILCVGWMALKRAARQAQNKEGGSSAAIPEVSLNDVPLPASRAILARTFHAVGESVPASRQDNEPLRKKLAKAGYRWPSAVTIFYGIKAASALSFAGAIGWTVLFVKGDPEAVLIPAFCSAGFGYLLPDRLLDRQVKNRAGDIRSGLPAAVDLLVLAIEAGQSLDQSMLDVAKALRRPYPILSEEFLFFHLEVRAGRSREEALRALAERSPEPELKKLVSVLLDGDRFGTSMGPALRTHSKYLRTRLRQGAQERARKLTVKLTMPTFFLIFPAVLVVTLGPAYLLLKDSLGRLVTGW